MAHDVTRKNMSFPTNTNSTNNFGVAQLIVDPIRGRGTHTTIANALTTAVSGQTIFIRPGTYTENPILKAGVNLTAFGCDSSLNGVANVVINGNCTLSTAGTVTISGIMLQTNSANCVTVSGSVASILNLNNCYINATNNTAISYSSSSSSSSIEIFNCSGNIGTTGIGLFSHSSAGSLIFTNSNTGNSGLSTTASTVSGSGNLQVYFSGFNFAVSTSSTSTFTGVNATINCTFINTTALTIGGTGNNFFYNGLVQSGSAAAISVSVSASLGIFSSTITSNNTNAITGAGAIGYQSLSFTGSSSTINTTTQTGSGTLQGSKNTAPTAGFLGEQIRSYQATPQSLAMSTNVYNITSIVLTAGVWDIDCVIAFQAGASYVGTSLSGGIGVTTATFGSEADSYSNIAAFPVHNVTDSAISIPAFRLVTTGQTVFLVASAVFSAGTINAFGRISATRVG